MLPFAPSTPKSQLTGSRRHGFPAVHTSYSCTRLPVRKRRCSSAKPAVPKLLSYHFVESRPSTALGGSSRRKGELPECEVASTTSMGFPPTSNSATSEICKPSNGPCLTAMNLSTYTGSPAGSTPESTSGSGVEGGGGEGGGLLRAEKDS